MSECVCDAEMQAIVADVGWHRHETPMVKIKEKRSCLTTASRLCRRVEE